MRDLRGTSFSLVCGSGLNNCSRLCWLSVQWTMTPLESESEILFVARFRWLISGCSLIDLKW